MKAPCWWCYSWLPRPPGTGTRAGLLDALRRSASADRAPVAACGAAASVRPFRALFHSRWRWMKSDWSRPGWKKSSQAKGVY